MRERWRLRDQRIHRKLGFILVVPIVAVVALAGISVTSASVRANRADRAYSLVVLGEVSGQLVSELQRERAAAALVFADAESTLDDYDSCIQVTNAVLERYRITREDAQATGSLDSLLDEIDEQLVDLDSLRQQVREGVDTAESVTIYHYRGIISDLIIYRLLELSQVSGVTSETASYLRASTALTQSIEALGQLQTLTIHAISAGRITPADQQEIIAMDTSYTDAFQNFQSMAPTEWVLRLNSTATGTTVVEAERLHGIITRAQPGELPDIETTVEEWTQAMATRMDLLHEVEQFSDAALVSEVTTGRASARRLVMGVMMAVVVGLLFVLAIGWWVSRCLVDSLTRLRAGAEVVATTRLPAMVSRLGSGDTAPTAEDIEDLVVSVVEPLAIGGRDEIGQVAEAFVAVSERTVRIAAEQACLRASVRSIFMALSRRLERRVETIVSSLDQAQAGEEDSRRLERLFAVDHRVTQFRRIIAGLQVQAGGRAGRSRARSVALPNVLRAAQGEIEQYTRVVFRDIDDKLFIRGDAVEEVIHLVAELLDNATRFSPPDTAVIVEARMAEDLLYLRITDEGTGMGATQMAEVDDVLTHPGRIDYRVASCMGLPVVSAIARRLGADVHLRSSPGRGTQVIITLPPTAVTTEPPPTLPPLVPALTDRPEQIEVCEPDDQTDDDSPDDQVDDDGAGRADEPPRRSAWFTKPAADAPVARRSQRAKATVDPVPEATTTSGLPLRDPGANAIPQPQTAAQRVTRTIPQPQNAAQRATSTIRHRDPEEARRRTAAFQQGLRSAGRRLPTPRSTQKER